jgi:hypothetical protein
MNMYCACYGRPHTACVTRITGFGQQVLLKVLRKEVTAA